MPAIPSVTLNNGVSMPQFGFGVFLMPPAETAKYVSVAFESGYRLIDTAAAYRNEEGVGEAIRNSGLQREEIFVTSKLWNSEHGYDKALKGFDSTMNKLGLDYLDLYLIHWPLPAKNLYTETWKALEQIYKDGRVKAIGLSNFNPDYIDRILQDSQTVPAVLQVELHPTFNQPELRRYAVEHGIQVECWYPLGGQKSKEQLLSLPLLTGLAKKYGKSPAQVVLRWHIQLGLVAIPKSANPGRIKENIDIFDFELSQEEVDSITALNNGVRVGSDPATANFE